MTTDKAVYFYGMKFPGNEEYASVQISLEQPEMKGKSPEEMWAYVIGQVDEQIVGKKSIKDIWEIEMSESLVGKSADEFWGRDYLDAEDLQGQAWQVEIKDVLGQMRWNPFQQEKTKTLALVFKAPNPLFNTLPEQRVLLRGKEDEQQLIALFGPKYADWVGKQVELFVYQKQHKRQQISKIGVRVAKGQPQQATKAKVGNKRPWDPATLQDALQKSAGFKKNDKTDAPIHEKVASLIGSQGPLLFFVPDTDKAEEAGETHELARERYHRLLDWVFVARQTDEESGEVTISANALKQYEGLAFAGWLLGKPLDKVGGPKEWFKTDVDPMARQEAARWLAENPDPTEPEMPDDGVDDHPGYDEDEIPF
jgi:hypothetical protein